MHGKERHVNINLELQYFIHKKVNSFIVPCCVLMGLILVGVVPKDSWNTVTVVQ